MQATVLQHLVRTLELHNIIRATDISSLDNFAQLLKFGAQFFIDSGFHVHLRAESLPEGVLKRLAEHGCQGVGVLGGGDLDNILGARTHVSRGWNKQCNHCLADRADAVQCILNNLRKRRHLLLKGLLSLLKSSKGGLTNLHQEAAGLGILRATLQQARNIVIAKGFQQAAREDLTQGGTSNVRVFREDFQNSNTLPNWVDPVILILS